MSTYKMTSRISLNNRNAFELLNVLNKFSGTVYIEKVSEGRQANAKSLLGLLSLNIMRGDEINVGIDDIYIDNTSVLKLMKDILDDE